MAQANDIMVSVYCLAYNHEKYIRNALESFVSQKTDFKYEVIVHDDASTDKTADIIREYEEKYPEIIKPIYQSENQYSKKIGIVKNHVFPRLSGKYVAICEGDDYWTDDNKLQMQVDALQANPDCSMSFHRVELFDLSKGAVADNLPRREGLAEGVITSKELVSLAVLDFIQLSSVMLRKSVYDNYMTDTPEYAKTMPVGDAPLTIYMAKNGKAYFVDKVMSRYNAGTEESWTKRVAQNREKHLEHFNKMQQGYALCKEFLPEEFGEVIDEAVLNAKVVMHESDSDFGYVLRKRYFKRFKTYNTKHKIKCVAALIFPKLVKKIEDKRK